MFIFSNCMPHWFCSPEVPAENPPVLLLYPWERLTWNLYLEIHFSILYFTAHSINHMLPIPWGTNAALRQVSNWLTSSTKWSTVVYLVIKCLFDTLFNSLFLHLIWKQIRGVIEEWGRTEEEEQVEVCRWIYERSYIWTAEKDMNTFN